MLAHMRACILQRSRPLRMMIVAAALSRASFIIFTNSTSQIVPLVVLFAVLGGLGFVGYQIYLSATKIQEQATKNIGNKNFTFTKDGMRVNVKEVKNEHYVDATQKVLVDVWNQHANTIGQTGAGKK